MPVELRDRRDEAHVPLANSSLLDELMTARQMADILQMRVSTVEGYARRGLLPSVKVGRHRRFIRSQVEQRVREQVGVTISDGVRARVRGRRPRCRCDYAFRA